MYISDHHLDILRAIRQAENGLSTDEVVTELKSTGFLWADTNKVASLLYYMRKKDLVVAMEGSYNRPKINQLTESGIAVLNGPEKRVVEPATPGSQESDTVAVETKDAYVRVPMWERGETVFGDKFSVDTIPAPENDKVFIEPLIPVSDQEFLGDEVALANELQDAQPVTLDADDPIEDELITLLKVIRKHEVQPAPVILDVDLKVQLLRKLAKLAHPDFGGVFDKIAEDLLRLSSNS